MAMPVFGPVFARYKDDMSNEAAESQANDGEMEKGPGMGIEKIMNENLSQVTRHIKTLAEAIREIRTDVSNLKRKGPNDDSEQPSASKRPKSTTNKVSDGLESAGKKVASEASKANACSEEQQIELADSSEDEDIDNFMQHESDEESNDSEEDDTLADLETFFQGQDECGPAVKARIAKVTNGALRGAKTKEDDEKLQALRKEHKRPENIENMQVPKIEDFLWRQLKRETRTYDFVQQKALESYNLILSPLVKALDLFKAKSGRKQAIKYVTEAYKIVGLTIKNTNNARIEKLKKELQPEYRSLCKPENTSATLLLGENVTDKIKKMKEGSKGPITMSNSHFLAKRGGTRNFKKSRGASQNYQNNYQNSYSSSYHNNYHNNFKKHPVGHKKKVNNNRK